MTQTAHPVGNHTTPNNGFFYNHRYLLGVLFLVGILRLAKLFQFCLDWDELNVLALAKLPFHSLWPVVLARDFHPPAYHTFLWGWIRLLGDSDTAVRLFAWGWGLLGVIAAERLSFELTNNKSLAALAALFYGLCPFIFRYNLLATPYSAYAACWLFSWWCLLRLLSPSAYPLYKRPVFWGYGVCTILACLMHAMGAILLLPLQLVWLLWQKHTRLLFKLLPLWLGCFLLLLPCLKPILLQTHAAHSPLNQHIHPQAPLWFMAVSPVSLMWLGDDTRDLSMMPAASILACYGLLTLVAFGWGAKQVRQHLPILVILGLGPILISAGISLITGLHGFHLRTFLPAVFSGWLLVASSIVRLWEERNALKIPSTVPLLTTLAVIWLCLLGPHQRPMQEDPWRWLGAVLQKDFRSGDGLVIDPGWNHLGVMRYFRPRDFGLTRSEQQVAMTGENHFEMAQQMDGDYFWMSGENTFQRPQVQSAFARFQRRHKRIWLVGDSPALFKQLDCNGIYFKLSPGPRFVPVRCQINP